MMTRYLVILMFILAALLAACTIEVSSPPPATVPPATTDGDPARPETAEPAVVSDVSPGESGLSGRLYYIALEGEQPRLIQLDLATGAETVIFQPPEDAWLNEISLSPDGSQILMSYAPPPEEGEVQFGFTDLYLMPADGGAAPALFRQRSEESETFFNITWPLDDLLYFSHFVPETDDTGNTVFVSQIERLPYPAGEAEVLVREAAWPRLSDDNTAMVYVSESNEFVIAAANGNDPRLLLRPSAFPAVDAPLFSPEGSMVYFSAVNEEPVSLLSIWDRLMGVKIAAAHTVPSDWWRMPADGSAEPERLTKLNAIGLYGDFSPDGRHIAFIAKDGLYVMGADGSGLTRLRNTATVGTIAWVP
jgi:Tol biopolymer transport system component